MDAKSVKQLDWRTVGLLAAMFVVAGIFWDTIFIYPIKLFVVALHEFSHGVAAILTGGSIVRIEIDYRIGGLCYLPDVSAIPDAVWPALAGLDVLILDTLRRKPHPTHAHLAQSLAWIERAAPRRAVLTDMHNDLDYATLAAELPAHIVPAYDGLVIETHA